MKKRSEATQTLHAGCSRQTHKQTDNTDRGDYNTLHSLVRSVMKRKLEVTLIIRTAVIKSIKVSGRSSCDGGGKAVMDDESDRSENELT